MNWRLNKIVLVALAVLFRVASSWAQTQSLGPTPSSIILVSRLSDARASGSTMFNGSSNPPAQIQTDFSPAHLSNSAMASGESGVGSGNCTSNSSIVVNNETGTLQITGDGGANASAFGAGGPASGLGSAKLIVLSFTLTDHSYSYSLSGQLSAQRFTGGTDSAATAKLTGPSGTIFVVVANNPPAVTLSETGVLTPGNYTLSVDVNASANSPGPGSSVCTSSANFNFALDPVSTPTPTPSPGLSEVDISGNISYCSNPVPGPVPDVMLNLTGSSNGSTLSDDSGNYTFSSVPTGGTYTVTPAKTALAPASAGINTVDVIATQRHFLNVTPIPPSCRLTAADVNGDTNVNTVDVVAIQRFYLGITTGTANVGKYQFSPASRAYLGLGSNQTGQNYDTLIFGDVAPPFAD